MGNETFGASLLLGPPTTLRTWGGFLPLLLENLFELSSHISDYIINTLSFLPWWYVFPCTDLYSVREGKKRRTEPALSIPSDRLGRTGRTGTDRTRPASDFFKLSRGLDRRRHPNPFSFQDRIPSGIPTANLPRLSRDFLQRNPVCLPRLQGQY